MFIICIIIYHYMRLYKYIIMNTIVLFPGVQNAGKAIRKMYLQVYNCNIYSSFPALNLFLGTG